jgi:hypothetical protein
VEDGMTACEVICSTVVAVVLLGFIALLFGFEVTVTRERAGKDKDHAP